jgi:S-adenosylmethionine:diacylglycerol 3-amino-3-carboxypropyl transferase
MAQETQLSVTVSGATRDKLDRFTANRGLKKNYVVEQALLFFMEARREWPDEAFIPSRVVLRSAEFDRLAKLIGRPKKPTRALVELMRGR